MYNSFEQDNLISSRLIFGCASLMNIKNTSERQKLLNKVYEKGINHFDVAPIYGFGECEKELAKFIVNKEKVKITSKFGLGTKGITKTFSKNQNHLRSILRKNLFIKKIAHKYYSNFSLEKSFNIAECKKSIKNSLRILGIEKIENYLLHEPSIREEIQIGIEDTLIYLKEEGLFKNYGISGYKTNLNLIYKNRPKLFKEVVQTDGGIFKDESENILNQCKVRIKFGILKSSLPKLKNIFTSFEFISDYWSNRLNLDLRDEENLCTIILAAALSKNNKDKIIFSTLKIGKLEKMIDTIRNPIWDIKEIEEFGKFFCS